jgi:hypothetical protein
MFRARFRMRIQEPFLVSDVTSRATFDDSQDLPPDCSLIIGSDVMIMLFSPSRHTVAGESGEERGQFA